MKRRKFIQSTAMASALPFTYVTGKEWTGREAENKELYELRCYEIRFGADQGLLADYLNEVLRPALQKKGLAHFRLFSELDQEMPVKIWALMAYPDANTYLQCQLLHGDPDFREAAKTYNEIAPNQAIFNRFSSSLFLAFDSLPKMEEPVEGASVFELRTYEGYSEDAVQRKIKMFDEEELALFYKTGLHPVFFGEMIAGPYRPCLAYMLNFRDMEERDAHWEDFIGHPEWKEMSSKAKYDNTVSNIRRVFLQPW